MDISELYYGMILFFVLGGASVFIGKKPATINYLAHGMAALGCVMAVLCAIFVLVNGILTVSLPATLPFGKMEIRLDALSAYFLLVLGVAGFGTSVYAIGYAKEYYERGLKAMAFLYNLFLLSMAVVLSVQHAVAFLISWEIMAVSSFLLVNQEHEKKGVRRAAFVYMVMTHVGTAFIATAFLLLASVAGGFTFAQFKGLALNEMTCNVIFFCACIGFGTKAGLIPLHIWLPQAHPAAPSHVSALMSGVMLKLAIYGMCRFFFEFLAGGPAWWGGVILTVGIVSAFLGALYALMENDMKRLLAYSSVENIGIILLGVGAALLAANSHQPLAAGIALVAALVHVLNHAVFKSLLFMGAGSVLQQMHTKNMERMGGLIRKMPYTAVFVLVAGCGMAALPPVNGFIGEWLTFQALFLLPVSVAGLGGKLLAAILIALLGMTGALAAMAFVKLFGLTFLAKPRGKKELTHKESSFSMLFGMGILAFLCLGLGMLPQLLLRFAGKIVAMLPQLNSSGVRETGNWLLIGTAHRASGGISPLFIVLLFVSGLAVAWLLYHLYGRPRAVARETWTCGIIPTARMEYSAVGFSQPLGRVFGWLLQAKSEVEEAGAHPYLARRRIFRRVSADIFRTGLYEPVNRYILKLAQWMKHMQTGSVQLYISYILAATLLVLLWSMR